MKKIISLILALCLTMISIITAFAAEGDATGAGTGTYSTNVTGAYVAGTEASGTVFSVDISWTAMDFTYYAEKAPVWDATNHKYSEVTPAKWEGEGTITVTNHSNAKIAATPEYTPGKSYETADMIFNASPLYVASAESGSAQVGTIMVTPTGYLPKMETAATIGSITVTISHDTRITIAEANALLTKAQERQPAWEAAGYGSQAEALINNIRDFISAISSGVYEEQDQIEMLYDSLLYSYNDLESKVNG